MTTSRTPVRIFINADDPTEADRPPVALSTHFPGRARIVREDVRSNTPGGPYVERIEIRGMLVINTTSFEARRAEVAALWPEAIRLIPPGPERIRVTIESMCPSQTAYRPEEFN